MELRAGHRDVRGSGTASAGTYAFEIGEEMVTGWHTHDLHQLEYAFEGVAQVESICTQIARDIRHQYTIGYYPTNTARDGTFRPVRLELIPPKGHGKLSVRTRTGYYASKTATGN